MTTSSDRTVVVEVPGKQRPGGWRDLVLVLETIALAAMVILLLQGRSDARGDRADASSERAALRTQISALSSQVSDLNRQLTLAQQENTRLRSLLLRHGVDPGPVLVISPLPSSSSPSSPSPQPSTPAPSPRPQPRPTPRPTPKPAPTPTNTGLGCVVNRLTPLVPCIG